MLRNFATLYEETDYLIVFGFHSKNQCTSIFRRGISQRQFANVSKPGICYESKNNANSTGQL